VRSVHCDLFALRTSSKTHYSMGLRWQQSNVIPRMFQRGQEALRKSAWWST